MLEISHDKLLKLKNKLIYFAIFSFVVPIIYFSISIYFSSQNPTLKLAAVNDILSGVFQYSIILFVNLIFIQRPDMRLDRYSSGDTITEEEFLKCLQGNKSQRIRVYALLLIIMVFILFIPSPQFSFVRYYAFLTTLTLAVIDILRDPKTDLEEYKSAYQGIALEKNL